MATTIAATPTMTDAQIAAYNAVLDAATRLMDECTDDPDNGALEWTGEDECAGFSAMALAAIDDLRYALRPFLFGNVKRLVP